MPIIRELIQFIIFKTGFMLNRIICWLACLVLADEERDMALTKVDMLIAYIKRAKEFRDLKKCEDLGIDLAAQLPWRLRRKQINRIVSACASRRGELIQQYYPAY